MPDLSVNRADIRERLLDNNNVMHHPKLMKYLKWLFLFIFIIFPIAYCNTPLTKHTLLRIDINNAGQSIKLIFQNIKEENIAIWEQKNKYFNWYNEMGYNGNGPDVPIDKILTIKKVIIASPSCTSQTINVEFTKKYSPQDYTKYFHHGSKAHMQYSFIKIVSLKCNHNA